MLGPTYFTIEQIKPYLQGKVMFGTDPETQMSDDFMSFICYQSESEVLIDINQLYEIPLRSVTYGIDNSLLLVPPDVITYTPDGVMSLIWNTEPVGWSALINSSIIQVQQDSTTGTSASMGLSGYTLTITTTIGFGWNTIDPITVAYFNPNYEFLPQHTKGYLLNLFVTKSVFDILNEDFGQKSNVDGNDMLAQYEKKYHKLLSRLTAKDPKTNQFKYGLLPDLAVNKGNWTGRKVVPRPTVSRSGYGPDNMKYAIRQSPTPAVGWLGEGWYGYGRNGQGR